MGRGWLGLLIGVAGCAQAIDDRLEDPVPLDREVKQPTVDAGRPPPATDFGFARPDADVAVTPPDAGVADARCVDACARIDRCLGQICGGPSIDQPGCLALCAPDPESFNVDFWNDAGCRDVQGLYCATDEDTRAVCDCDAVGNFDPEAFNLGAECQVETDCRAGDLQAVCLTAEFGFPGGYCSGVACAGGFDCGPGGSCALEAEDGTTFCAVECEIDATCRAGYVCEVGVCYPPQASGG